ncbi:hypothetical protein B0H12DRAFT_223790 [Mycena haematopus]|nr:hypothetical protein B0H12DRAFT_223790 [Mycena haematopus]
MDSAESTGNQRSRTNCSVQRRRELNRYGLCLCRIASMSELAALAEAYAARDDAFIALAAALDTPDESAARAAADHADHAADTARLAADALAQPVILALLEYHGVPTPSTHTLALLLAAVHQEHFAHLAELADTRLNYPHAVLLSFRQAWRRHHQRLEQSPRNLLSFSLRRFFLCATFGEAAFIMEDEHSVPDDLFRLMRNCWRVSNGRKGVSDTVVQCHCAQLSIISFYANMLAIRSQNPNGLVAGVV